MGSAFVDTFNEDGTMVNDLDNTFGDNSEIGQAFTGWGIAAYDGTANWGMESLDDTEDFGLDFYNWASAYGESTYKQQLNTKEAQDMQVAAQLAEQFYMQEMHQQMIDEGLEAGRTLKGAYDDAGNLVNSGIQAAGSLFG
jgi:hypothetical protein